MIHYTPADLEEFLDIHDGFVRCGWQHRPSKFWWTIKTSLFLKGENAVYIENPLFECCLILQGDF